METDQNKNKSRRDFLITTTALAGGFASLFLLKANSLCKPMVDLPVPAPPERKMGRSCICTQLYCSLFK